MEISNKLTKIVGTIGYMAQLCDAYTDNVDNVESKAVIEELVGDEIIDTAIKILIECGYSVKKTDAE